MTDLSAMSPTPPVGIVPQPTPERTSQSVPAPDKAGADRPPTEPKQKPTQANPLQRLEEQIDRRLSRDADRPTGPPPAFETSLLELEADIDSAIRRVQANREKAGTHQAVRPEMQQPNAPNPDAEQTERAAQAFRAPLTPYDVKPAAEFGEPPPTRQP